MAERFKFVAKEFQPGGPRAGQRPDIEDAAAQGDFTFLGDLGFRLIALFFEPFDQIQGIDLVPALTLARALLDFAGWKGLLEQGGDAGDDQGGERRAEGGLGGLGGQGHQRLKAVTDGIGMRELAFVGKKFPGGVKQQPGAGSGRLWIAGLGLWGFGGGLNLQPGFNILLKTFLRFQIRGDDDQWPTGKNGLQQNRKERLCRPANAVHGQRSAMLQSLRQGLHSGRVCDISEQMACRRRCRVLRQAGGRSQRPGRPSSGGRFYLTSFPATAQASGA